MLKIALAQTNAVLGDKVKNLIHLEEICNKAKENNSQIICFPELATTGYSPSILGKYLYSLSESHGENTDMLFAWLSKTLDLIIICGFIEKNNTTGEIYNSAGIWVPEEKNWLGVFRKMHLTHDDKKWFTSGENLPVFDTKICRIGVMICYDAGFPEVARSLALKNADIIFLLSAWPEKDKDIWYINTPCRAIENTIHLAAVNRWGQEGKTKLFGGSQIVGPRGQIFARASETGEDIIYHEIALDLQTKTRISSTYLNDRKPDCYTSIVQS